MPPAIAIVGTFDSKGEEHAFVKACIEARGFPTRTIHVGTKGPPACEADHDLFAEVIQHGRLDGRDTAIEAVLTHGRTLVRDLYLKGEICGIISAGGGTGTYLSTGIMRGLPMGVPKVMVSTVAARDMGSLVGTRDITMIHSVVDLLGINSLSGRLLDQAAGAVCGMAASTWHVGRDRPRIAMSMFGFVNEGAERIRKLLEARGYEVIPFHANGTGGMAMEDLAAEGHFTAILDLATHELADELKGGYCAGIGPQRLRPPAGRRIPRLVVPGGLDCAVLEFTRESIPDEHRECRIFFYDFRSAIRLSEKETMSVADRIVEALNRDPLQARVLVPAQGWSEADREGAPLHDPRLCRLFVQRLRARLDPRLPVDVVDGHINDARFAQAAAAAMDQMIKRGWSPRPISMRPACVP